MLTYSHTAGNRIKMAARPAILKLSTFPCTVHFGRFCLRLIAKVEWLRTLALTASNQCGYLACRFQFFTDNPVNTPPVFSGYMGARLYQRTSAWHTRMLLQVLPKPSVGSWYTDPKSGMGSKLRMRAYLVHRLGVGLCSPDQKARSESHGFWRLTDYS